MLSHLQRQMYLIPSFVYILKDFDARLNILMINIGNRCKTHLKPHEEGQVFDTCRISARRQRGLERKCCFREVFQHPVPGSNLRICHFLEVIFNRGVSLCFIFSQKDVFFDAGSLGLPVGLTARPSILAASQHCQHPRLIEDVDLTRYLDHT